MTALLNLVPKLAQKRARSPRPIHTYYYATTNEKTDFFTYIGRASTPIGALSAATRNVLNHRIDRADIYDARGYLKFRIARHANGNVRIQEFR